MTPQRRILRFSGRVQGVGFRMTAVHLAHGLTLTGTVRNLEDGGVELIAQGPEEDIDTLLFRLREHFGSFIRTVQQEVRPPSPFQATSVGITIIHE